MKTVRKLALMYREFGKAESGECKDCNYFLRINHHGKIYRKCQIYGVTLSDATDWLAHGHACGLFPDKPADVNAKVVRMVERMPSKEGQIQGQMNLFEKMQEEISDVANGGQINV